jgi:hypothetical protein
MGDAYTTDYYTSLLGAASSYNYACLPMTPKRMLSAPPTVNRLVNDQTNGIPYSFPAAFWESGSTFGNVASRNTFS